MVEYFRSTKTGSIIKRTSTQSAPKGSWERVSAPKTTTSKDRSRGSSFQVRPVVELTQIDPDKGIRVTVKKSGSGKVLSKKTSKYVAPKPETLPKGSTKQVIGVKVLEGTLPTVDLKQRGYTTESFGVKKVKEEIKTVLDTRTGKQIEQKFLTIGGKKISVDPRSQSIFQTEGRFLTGLDVKESPKEARTPLQKSINILNLVNKKIEDNIVTKTLESKANITLRDLETLKSDKKYRVKVQLIPGTEKIRLVGLTTGRVAGTISIAATKSLIKAFASLGVGTVVGAALLGSGVSGELGKFYDDPRGYTKKISRVLEVTGKGLVGTGRIIQKSANDFINLPVSEQRRLIKKGVVITGSAAGTAGVYITAKSIQTVSTKKGQASIGEFLGSTFAFSKYLQAIKKLYRANKMFLANSLEKKLLKKAVEGEGKILTKARIKDLEKLGKKLGANIKVKVQEVKGVKVGIAGTKTKATGVRQAILGKARYTNIKDIKDLPKKYILVGKAQLKVQKISPGVQGVTVPALSNVEQATGKVSAIVSAKKLKEISKLNLKQTIQRMGLILDDRLGSVAFSGKFVPVQNFITQNTSFRLSFVGKAGKNLRSIYKNLGSKIKPKLNFIQEVGIRKLDKKVLSGLPKRVRAQLKNYKIKVYKDFKTGKEIMLKKDRGKLRKVISELAGRENRIARAKKAIKANKKAEISKILRESKSKTVSRTERAEIKRLVDKYEADIAKKAKLKLAKTNQRIQANEIRSALKKFEDRIASKTNKIIKSKSLRIKQSEIKAAAKKYENQLSNKIKSKPKKGKGSKVTQQDIDTAVTKYLRELEKVGKKPDKILEKVAKSKKLPKPRVETGEIIVTKKVFGKDVVIKFDPKSTGKADVKKRVKQLSDIIGKAEKSGATAQLRAQSQLLKLKTKQKLTDKKINKIKQEISKLKKTKRVPKSKVKSLEVKLDRLTKTRSNIVSRVNKASRVVSKAKYKSDIKGALASAVKLAQQTKFTQSNLLKLTQKVKQAQDNIQKDLSELRKDNKQIQEQVQDLSELTDNLLLQTSKTIQRSRSSTIRTKKIKKEEPPKKVKVKLIEEPRKRKTKKKVKAKKKVTKRKTKFTQTLTGKLTGRRAKVRKKKFTGLEEVR